jgi:uncharacterized DUF497 family protein
MGITYDPAKNERNIRERGLSFERAADFDFETALIADYSRHGEKRRVAVGYLDRRLHLLCYIPIPDGIRVIRFRRANQQEGGEALWQTANH